MQLRLCHPPDRRPLTLAPSMRLFLALKAVPRILCLPQPSPCLIQGPALKIPRRTPLLLFLAPELAPLPRFLFPELTPPLRFLLHEPTPPLRILFLEMTPPLRILSP